MTNKLIILAAMIMFLLVVNVCGASSELSFTPLAGNSEFFVPLSGAENFFVSPSVGLSGEGIGFSNLYEILVCPTDTLAKTVMIGIIFALALFFILFGGISGVPIFTMLGGIMLLVLSFYIYGCIGFVAGVTGVIGVIVIVFSVIKGLSN